MHFLFRGRECGFFCAYFGGNIRCDFKENVYYESAIPLDFMDILHMVTFYSNNIEKIDHGWAIFFHSFHTRVIYQ